MKKTILTYTHTRNIFQGNEFKSFVNRYFKNPRFEGSDSGGCNALLSVTNYDKVKGLLPKYAQPIKVEETKN